MSTSAEMQSSRRDAAAEPTQATTDTADGSSTALQAGLQARAGVHVQGMGEEAVGHTSTKRSLVISGSFRSSTIISMYFWYSLLMSMSCWLMLRTTCQTERRGGEAQARSTTLHKMGLGTTAAPQTPPPFSLSGG